MKMIKVVFLAALAGAVLAERSSKKSSDPPHHVEISDPHIPWNAGDMSYNKSMKHFSCGTTQRRFATADFNKTVDKLHKQQEAEASSWLARSGGSGAARARLARRAAAAATQAIEVPVYIHVVTKSSSASMFTQSMVNAQASVLNQLYSPYGIHFTLQGTTFTQNDDWAVGGGSSDTAMKTALRRGNYNALNLYFQSDLSGGILGFCTLPGPTTNNPSSYVGDGCNIAAGTMPGGPIMGYNQGKTAVHETGHWLGLLHTFEGNSCSGPGDYVVDTPAEAQSTSGCPTNPWKNTCPRKNANTVDPIHNYMDYSIDSCYSRFSPGQKQRMFNMWSQYRQAYGGGLTTSQSSPSTSANAGASASASVSAGNGGGTGGYGYAGGGAYNHLANTKGSHATAGNGRSKSKEKSNHVAGKKHRGSRKKKGAKDDN